MPPLCQKPCPRVDDRGGAVSGRGGFSLVELLITLALLLVLTTMYWGFSSRSHQEQQKKACAQNLQKIYVALEIFANEHTNGFPDLPGATTSEEPLAELVPRYTVDTSIFICPGSKDAPLPSGESILRRKISYAYYMGRQQPDASEALMSDRQVDTNSKSAGQLAFSDTGKPPGNNHYKYGGNVLFCDGRVEPTAARLAFSLVVTQGVVLLNPKP